MLRTRTHVLYLLALQSQSADVAKSYPVLILRCSSVILRLSLCLPEMCEFRGVVESRSRLREYNPALRIIRGVRPH